MISLRLCHLVILVMVNYHWFPSDFVTWVLISLRHCHLVMLIMVNYHWFPSDFVTWSFWLWLIIIDFPQILSLGHVGYGKLSLISLILCHVVMLVKVNYHWFPSDFVTWLCWLWEIIIDFPQTLSRGHIGYGKLSLISLTLSLGYWFPSDIVTWSCWLWLIIIDFPQILSLGHAGYG